MNPDQIMIFSILTLVLVFFVWGKWRYDIVAFVALILSVILGLVPTGEAFSGFGNPAVITVAAVLVISKGLLNSGLVDVMARTISKVGNNQLLQLTALLIAVSFSSAFMNNIGALALFMPVAIRLARKNNTSPSVLLMPMAFCSLLGGLITVIGTPPNILISAYRAEQLGLDYFNMFDFFPTGLGLTLAGVAFIVTIGWRLIPQRKGKLSREEIFKIEDYITEIKVTENSKFLGKMLRDVEQAVDTEIMVVGYFTEKKSFPAPSLFRELKVGDSLLVKANAEAIQELLDTTGMEMAVGTEHLCEDCLRSEEISIMEATVTPNSVLVGRTARKFNLRSKYNINLLGVAREGARLRELPDKIRFRAGDVLLLQGGSDSMQEALTELGCLPLAERGLKIGRIKRVFWGLSIFGGAIALAAFGVLPVQIAFSLAAVIMVIFEFVSLREVYTSIEWPIIVLLGAMLPVSRALETTGGAELLASKILAVSGTLHPAISIALVLIITMLLSNIVNNAAAVLLMAPIAVGIAGGLGAAFDPFLMAVAIGASSPFLTPIGHQSNTLVMGPGGYQFSDYWRLGLPLSILVVLVAIPLILMIWPLY